MPNLVIYHPKDFPRLPGSEDDKVVFYNDGNIDVEDEFGAVQKGDIVIVSLPLLSTNAFCPSPRLGILK